MMKVTILVSHLTGGGAERIAVDIADRLPEDISRKIVTILSMRETYCHSTRRISLVKRKKNGITALVLIISFIRYIKYLRVEKPDISLSLLTHPNLLNTIASFFTRRHHIISVHEMPSQNFTGAMNLIRDLVFTMAKYTNTQIVAVSYGVKHELMQMYNLLSDEITVIHNPIAVQKIASLSRESVSDLDLKTTGQYIMAVGRLSSVKGQWHLIRAFAELRKTRPSTLLICGVGEQQEYLESLAKECGVSDDVIFLGWQDNPYKYMARSTVFVQSSLSEALPNVLVESLACGCPVIAANCSGGIEEILGSDNSCGFIAEKMTGIRHSAQEPLDEGEQSLLKYMKIVLDNPELRASMSLAAKERAKLFDIDVGIQKYVELFEKVLSNR